eukprot:TRINITY_DN490_c4_g1_i1.p1 TRINITY_DN490_c4_g1~~TRINITY_DN490_c4_g1_i1.p1  ORF type:complete len:355 (+),score=142.94 TRINITY_DN490_c4_g1_i1:56-1120(+)
MAELTVDPEKKNDLYYRYKMPPVQIKVEGSGNGIKTVLRNITDIATRINRDVEYPMKYFGNDIGAHAKNEDSKWIVMGNHDRERLQRSLYDYICKFVLCKGCRNPETKTIVDEKKNIILRCGACGKDSLVDQKEKLNNLILKKEQVTYAEKEKSKKDKKDKKEKKEKKEKKRSKDEEEEAEFDAATRQADVHKDKIDGEATSDEKRRNPVVVLKEYLAEKPTEAEIINKVSDIKIEYGLREKEIMKLLGEAVFTDETFLKKIKPYAGVFKRFVADSTEKYVIECMELLIFEVPDIQDKFPIALKRLYDEEIVQEDAIITWYEGKLNKNNKELSQTLRTKSKPFIDWLQEEEDDD